MHQGIVPSDLFAPAFYLLVVAPVVGLLLAWFGTPRLRKAGGWVLFADALAYAGLTVLCLVHCREPAPRSGFNGLLLVAIVPAFFAWLLFALWRASRRHEYVQSLPAAQRRIEELVDLDRALGSARSGLARIERQAKGWFLGGAERRRLEQELVMQRGIVSRLEQERAKRL